MANDITAGANAETEGAPPTNGANRPTLSTVLLTLLPSLIFFGIMLLAYGDVWRFFEDPARQGMIVASVLMAIFALFSGSSGLGSGQREDRSNRWIFAPILLLTIVLAWLPPYLDGRNLWTLKQPIIPYVGLALFILGGVLRLAPVFALGRRFSGLVAIQQGHRLKTDGWYRFVRHPSYAGLLVNCTGLVLIFRCWLGLFLVVGFLAILLARIKAEEALLASTFGEEYDAYRRRTWRLVPWLY
jgi:protein-S-isoprenylcysteine O-methyltransferase Ste14